MNNTTKAITIGSYSEEYGQLRFIVRDGELLACATDIARSLGYKRPRDAVRDHCFWTETHTVPSIHGGTETVRFIDEFSAYEFIAHCCLPSAANYEPFFWDLFDKYMAQFVPFVESDEEDDLDCDEDEEDFSETDSDPSHDQADDTLTMDEWEDTLLRLVTVLCDLLLEKLGSAA